MLRCFAMLGMLVVQPFSPVGAFAADPKDISELSLFKVDVEGVRASTEKTEYAKGRAFAIGPETLITARHVTGNQTTWRNKNDSGLLYIPHRTITIKAVRKHGNPPIYHQTDKMFVTSAQVEIVDAVKLTAPKFEVKMLGTGLSACPIDPQKVFRALILRDNKLEKPRFVELTPDSDRTTDLNGAFRFFNEKFLSAPSKIGSGDSGSPVLNEKGHVIGLISAIESSGNEIFVTLVSSFIDLIPLQTPVDCAERVGARDIQTLKDKLTTLQGKISKLEAHNNVLTKADVFFANHDPQVVQRISKMIPKVADVFDHDEMAPDKVYKRLEKLRNNVISMQDNLLDWDLTFNPATKTFQISYRKLVESNRHVEFIDLEAELTNSEGKKAPTYLGDLRVGKKNNLIGVFETKAADGLANRIDKVKAASFKPGTKITEVKIVVIPKISGNAIKSKLIEFTIENYE